MKRIILNPGTSTFLLLFFTCNAVGEQILYTTITGSSSPEAHEIFSIETFEDLESILIGGYPIPWVAEILEDNTIPEEDRYWLDCRIRAIIAQNLHTFFNREGEPIQVDADWIRYGEDYWQEHFIVNPPGEFSRGEYNQITLTFDSEPDPATGLWGENGFVYSQFGEKTGELVLCEEWMQLSRDGSIGLLIHIGSQRRTTYGPVFLYFVCSDGTFHMNPEELWIYDYALSQSGNFALLVQRKENEPDPIEMFDRIGNLIWEQEATATMYQRISISPNSELCLIPSSQSNPLKHYIQVLDTANGNELTIYNEYPIFSPDGEILCIGSSCVSSDNSTEICSLGIQEAGLSMHELSFDNNAILFAGILHPPEVLISEEAKLAVMSRNGSIILEQPYVRNEKIILSPFGTFVLLISEYSKTSSTSCTIWRIDF